MGSSITKTITLLFVLSIAKIGYTQNVFNEAFDEGNISNHSANALEHNGDFIFTQKIFKNTNTHIEAVKLDSLGNLLQKESVIVDSNLNINYGYAGSFQDLSSNEFCQLYHVALDSGINLVFFDSDLIVIRNEYFDFNFFLNASIVKQINDSTLLILGRIQNSSTFDLFLINTDLQGNERWRTIFGESGKNDYGFAIEYVNNKILVGGQTYYTGQIAHPHIFEFSNSGQLLFDTTYLQFDNGGQIIYHNTYGIFLYSTRNNYPISVYPIIHRINSDYSISWSNEYFMDAKLVTSGAMTINDNGIISLVGNKLENNVITGLFFQINNNGDSLGAKLIDHISGETAYLFNIRPTSDGGYILAGETDAPTQDSWIVKVNAWGCDNIPCVVGINEQPRNEDNELNCYPNPSNGWGTLKGSFENGHSANEIKIFNSLGQLVFSKTIVAKEFEMEVNLPSSGLYLVNLYQRDMVVKSLKWVVR